MKHDRRGVGVVEEIEQLVFAVAVVGVDGHEAGLERGEHRFEVFDPVVEVLGDLVLLAKAVVEQRASDAVGVAVEVAPTAPLVAVDERRRIGEAIGDRFPDVGQLPVRHAHPPSVIEHSSFGVAPTPDAMTYILPSHA